MARFFYNVVLTKARGREMNSEKFGGVQGDLQFSIQQLV